MKLMILGNGFDLAVGLNTSYEHYIYSTHDVDKEIIRESNKLSFIKNNKLCLFNLYTYFTHDNRNTKGCLRNYWDYILYAHKIIECLGDTTNPLFKHPLKTLKLKSEYSCEGWCDVETIIYKSLYIIQLMDSTGIIRAIENKSNNESEFNTTIFKVALETVKHDKQSLVSEVEVAIAIAALSIVSSKDIDHELTIKQIKIKLIDFLKEELSLFENNFNKFITHEEYCQPKESQKRGMKLARAMVGEYNAEAITSKRIQSPFKKYLTIFNFNYTNPCGIGRQGDVAVNYIHGKGKKNISQLTESQIIFGIDSCECIDGNIVPIKKSDERYKFTKAYRRLSVGENDFPEDVKEICFFGHSLSHADYSFFQVMFDYYSIYLSDVKLSFFCKAYGGNDENYILKKEIDRVVELLLRYSRTLDLKGDGDNLINKLKLEGRLNIKLIEQRSLACRFFNVWWFEQK